MWSVWVNLVITSRCEKHLSESIPYFHRSARTRMHYRQTQWIPILPCLRHEALAATQRSITQYLQLLNAPLPKLRNFSFGMSIHHPSLQCTLFNSNDADMKLSLQSFTAPIAITSTEGRFWVSQTEYSLKEYDPMITFFSFSQSFR